MIKRMKLITCLLLVLFIAITFSCSTKKEESFSQHFLSNQWRADYGKEGAPIVDSTTYNTFVFRNDSIITPAGDVGVISSARDTIHFRGVPTAWVLVKKLPVPAN